MAFHPAQLRAIRHKEGPMLVLAGPGSGKTTVIVNRLSYLIAECGEDPEKILVITFTRAAAEEMQQRYQKHAAERGGAPAASPVFGTFHSVFFSILKKYAGFSAKSLITAKDQRAVLKKILADPALPMIYTDDLAEALLSEIGRMKNKGGIPEPAKAAGTAGEPVLRTVCRRYEAMLRNMGLLDFDDMLLLCRELFLKRPEILEKERARFRYLLIDEFQDINALQYEIVQMLSAAHRNLFIVGDDDQSIYAFRGSEPRIMLNFPKDYPNCKTVLLEVNYRSGAEIVRAAGRLIAHNRIRFRKRLSAGRKLPSGVRAEEFASEKEEFAALCGYIRGYREHGLGLSEMAVLCRTNGELSAVAEKLRQAGIAVSGQKEEGVRLYTFHASKGLEFTVVFIIAAGEGITPHPKSTEGAALEEERRMFYVAMTRARQYLHILNTKTRYNKPQKRSRFVKEVLR